MPPGAYRLANWRKTKSTKDKNYFIYGEKIENKKEHRDNRASPSPVAQYGNYADELPGSESLRPQRRGGFRDLVEHHDRGR
jgi:hypothetical protein